MLKILFKIYAYLFGRVIFININKFLYLIALRGLGILNHEKEYLTGEKEWLKKYLKNKKNATVIDVGANIGNYSKKILKINSDTKLFAFEPHPKTFNRLKNNVKASLFYPLNLGVGDKEEDLTLYDYDTNDGSQHASLYKEVIEDLHKGKSNKHIVKVVTLDKFLTKQKIGHIDLLKIDVEGNEYNVLLGTKDYLSKKKIRAIHFEFNEMNIISKTSFKDFWDYLSGYQLYRLLPGGELFKINVYSPIFCEIYAYQNIIAILKE